MPGPTFTTLTFDEPFNGSTLDSTKWSTLCWFNNNGAGGANSNELQAYTPQSVTMSGGVCSLTAAAASPQVGGKDYTSGLLCTYQKFAQRYGRFVARIKNPSGAGFWPTFWLLPADASWPPEIDIMEQHGDYPHQSEMWLHYGVGNTTVGGAYSGSDDYTAAFFDYELQWSPGLLVWYIDGIERQRITANIPDIAMHMVVNLAIVNRNGVPAVLPQDVQIDFVRVWSLDP